MNTIMSIINGRTVASEQTVIEKHYPTIAKVIAKIQHSKSAMLDKALWHALEFYAEVKTNYV